MNIDNIKKIEALHNKLGDPVFRMAISHLFDVGYRSLTEESVQETKAEINSTTKKNSFMTTDFQCALVDAAFELSTYSPWDLLLYIKLYVGMDGDNLQNRKNAEQSVRLWATERKDWKNAIEDADVLSNIVDELIDQHIHNNYTREEIESAFEYGLLIAENPLG